jgi:predicted ester cyclase
MTRDGIDKAARRFVMEHNSAQFRQAFDELLAPDVVVHEYLPGVPPSLDRGAYEGFIATFRAALPDIRDEVNDLLVDGDRAAVRWTGHGTHTGEALMGLPAKGSRLTAHGIYILRFRGGQIAEAWGHWDNLGVLEQLKGA